MQDLSRTQPLLEALERIGAALDIDALVEALRRTARRAIGADGICIVRRAGAMVHYVAEDAIAPLWTGQQFMLRHCISGLSMLDGQPILIPDTLRDDRVPQLVYAGTFVRSMAMFPIGYPDPSMALGAYWRTTGEIDPLAADALARLAIAAGETLARAAPSVQIPSSLTD